MYHSSTVQFCHVLYHAFLKPMSLIVCTTGRYEMIRFDCIVPALTLSHEAVLLQSQTILWSLQQVVSVPPERHIDSHLTQKRVSSRRLSTRMQGLRKNAASAMDELPANATCHQRGAHDGAASSTCFVFPLISRLRA